MFIIRESKFRQVGFSEDATSGAGGAIEGRMEKLEQIRGLTEESCVVSSEGELLHLCSKRQVFWRRSQ